MSAVVQGVPELINRLRRISEDGKANARAIVGSIADMIVNDAKFAAPADLGKIRQGIGKSIESNKDRVIATVFSNAPESPYQEFGTGGKVDVPAEMQDVASQFQGQSGGSMQDFILALTEWVKRHGLTGVYSVKTHKRNTRLSNTDDDTKAAWAIARSILKNGLKPQPFLYPAYVANIGKLKPMLEAALKGDLNR